MTFVSTIEILLVTIKDKKMTRPGRTRLTIDLPIVVYEQLKSLAKKYNITLTRCVIRILIDQFNRENERDFGEIRNRTSKK